MLAPALDETDGKHENLPIPQRPRTWPMLYTSGSTGRRKARRFRTGRIRTVRDTNYIELDPSQVIAQTSNFCFDGATFEIWEPC